MKKHIILSLLSVTLLCGSAYAQQNRIAIEFNKALTQTGNAVTHVVHGCKELGSSLYANAAGVAVKGKDIAATGLNKTGDALKNTGAYLKNSAHAITLDSTKEFIEKHQVTIALSVVAAVTAIVLYKMVQNNEEEIIIDQDGVVIEKNS